MWFVIFCTFINVADTKIWKNIILHIGFSEFRQLDICNVHWLYYAISCSIDIHVFTVNML